MLHLFINSELERLYASHWALWAFKIACSCSFVSSDCSSSFDFWILSSLDSFMLFIASGWNSLISVIWALWWSNIISFSSCAFLRSHDCIASWYSFLALTILSFKIFNGGCLSEIRFIFFSNPYVLLQSPLNSFSHAINSCVAFVCSANTPFNFINHGSHCINNLISLTFAQFFVYVNSNFSFNVSHFSLIFQRNSLCASWNFLLDASYFDILFSGIYDFIFPAIHCHASSIPQYIIVLKNTWDWFSKDRCSSMFHNIASNASHILPDS